ncbi:MAG: sensor histidine kinase, partial [Promethearchaeota archaeon]
MDEETKMEVLDLIVENSIAGIFLFQHDMVMFANRAARDVIGYSFNEMEDMGANLLSTVIHPDDFRFVSKLIDGKAKGGGPGGDGGGCGSGTNCECRVLRKDGGITWVRVMLKRVIFNSAPCLFLSIIDISGKKRLERDLRDSDEKFRIFSELSPSGLLIFRRGDGKITFINEQAAKIFEYSMSYMKSSWSKEHVKMKIHPDDSGYDILACGDSLELGKYKEFCFRIIAKNGQVKSLVDLITCLKYNGEDCELHILTDTTEIKEAIERIMVSEIKFRHIFENSSAAIIIMNSKGRIIDCNKQALKLFSRVRDDFVGKKYKDAHQSFKENRVRLAELFHDVLEGKDVEPIEIEMEGGFSGSIDNTGNIDTGDTGGTTWIGVHAGIVHLRNVDYIEMVIHDITNKKKLAKVLELELQKLRELDTTRKNIISYAAHELKTPLVSIYSATDFLLKTLDHELGENAKEIVTIIHRGGERMKNLIETMLDISRIEAGQFQLHKTNTDLVGLIEKIIGNMRYLSRNKAHEITTHLPRTLNVNIDKLRIEQVITNLLSNAIKNTGEFGKIIVELNKVSNTVIFTIQDDGVGLIEDEMKILFTQFGKIPKEDSTEGSGLGLYICKIIIEKHGGIIWGESEGRGRG